MFAISVVVIVADGNAHGNDDGDTACAYHHKTPQLLQRRCNSQF